VVNSYAVEYKVIGDREALLAASGRHPYVMLTTTGDVTGYRADGLLGWIAREPDRTQIFALGEAAAALAFVRRMRGDARWAHLPRLTKAQVAPFGADVHDDWEHLIARTAARPDRRTGCRRCE
jgi:hypothetical protein